MTTGAGDSWVQAEKTNSAELHHHIQNNESPTDHGEGTLPPGVEEPTHSVICKEWESMESTLVAKTQVAPVGGHNLSTNGQL